MSELTTDVIESARSRAGFIEDLTSKLVAIPTENPPGNCYAESAALLTATLSELGWAPRVIEAPGEHSGSRRSIILAGPEDEQPVLTFHGHYDVVPADHADQFAPRREGRRLIGRGTADMKGGVAAMIHAAAAVREVAPHAGNRIALVLVPDEETGGLLGSGYLQKRELLGRNSMGMLTPEPTSGVIWHACRGAFTLQVTIHGRHAHVGHHYEGINAFEQMVRLANDLAELKQSIETRETRFSLDSEPDPALARKSILMMGGTVEGGTSFNAAPSRMSFTIERRFNPEEDRDIERERLLSLLELHRSEGVDLTIEVLQDAPAAAAPVDDPLARAVIESTETVLGERPRLELCPGLLEIRWYAQQGVPAYAFGPGLLSVSHGPDEYVDLDALSDYAAIYALTAFQRLTSVT
ncbi:MAG: M20/M25/M40 family metallo-hydrolase [Thermomicrobiales bacterium]